MMNDKSRPAHRYRYIHRLCHCEPIVSKETGGGGMGWRGARDAREIIAEN